MKLYLIQRMDHVGYDESSGFVIRAKNEERAREIASDQHSDEGKEIWFKAKTKCTILLTKGKEGVILSDFNAG